MIKSNTSEAKRQYNEAHIKKGWITLPFIMNNRCKAGKRQGWNTDSLPVQRRCKNYFISMTEKSHSAMSRKI
jgi:hypothetical protein